MTCIYKVRKSKREKISCWVTPIIVVVCFTPSDSPTLSGNANLNCLDYSKSDQTGLLSGNKARWTPQRAL